MTNRIVLIVALLLSGMAMAQDGPRILLLTKSAGYEHAVVKNDELGNNHVSTVLKELAAKNGASLVSTKDARLINALTLEGFDLVIFYTSGDLLTSGGDGSPAMSVTGVSELTEWIKAGGGFMGIHPACDNFHGAGDEVTPYIKLLGGEFLTHGVQFEGHVDVVDETHPAVSATPSPWYITDEWYVFKNMNTEDIHVLAMLRLGNERQKQEKYNVPDYPITWCSTLGKGRVYYTAQGHRADVWTNENFQNSLLAAANWAIGNGPTQAKPNYKKVVKEEGRERIMMVFPGINWR